MPFPRSWPCPSPPPGAPEDFISLDISQPLAKAHGWTLVDTGDQTQGYPLWRQAMASLFEIAAQALEETWPLPAGAKAFAALSGSRTYRAWNGPGHGMGFHALLAHVYDEDEGEDYLDVPDAHMCHVNLDALDRECRNDLQDQAIVLSALATLPHEMAHVALFARHTQGKTPLEVFDEGGGEMALKKVLDNLEGQAIKQMGQASPYGGNEDVVEGFATGLVDQWYLQVPRAREMVGQLVESLQARPAPRRRAGP